MNSISALANRLLDASRHFAWLPPLFARVVIGWVFVSSGWGKIHHIDKVIGFFESLALPAPAFQAHLVAYTELVAGLLVLFGLATRLASIPLIVIMIVALRTAFAEQLSGSLAQDVSALTGLAEFLYIPLLVWLIVAGPGRLSLDEGMARSRRRG